MFSTAARRIRHAATRHPLLLDTLLAAAIAGPAMAAASHPGGSVAAPSSGSVGVAVFSFMAVACRRLWPLHVLLATAAAAIAYTLTAGTQQPVLTIALTVAVYTLASRTERKRMWLLAAGIALPLYLAAVLTSSSNWWAPQNLGTLAWIGLATAVGDAAGSRRAYVAEVEERARRAEQTRDDEAHRRVVEERIRIAQELHDVVSHHIAVINVQAGAAAYVLHQQPDAARHALGHIRHASDTVLRELASMVGVLRQAGDLDTGTEPTRGLARLTRLLDTVAAAGLRVELHQDDDARELPAVVDLSAYRILQEALTNAHKHGTGTARLTIGYSPGDIVIEVTNLIGSPGPDNGFGLLGMRERAAATGGTLTAGGQPDGTFRVRAVLPTPTAKDQP